MNAVSRFDHDVDPLDVLVALRESGCAIVESLCPSSQMDGIATELDPLIAAQPLGSDEFLGLRSKRVHNLLAKSTRVGELAIHPLLMDVAERFFAPVACRFQMNFTGILHIGPGERAQDIHRDTLIYPFRSPFPPVTLATIWAYTDFTAENGATAVVPGSHLWKEGREPRPEEIHYAEMPRGSVMMYAGNLLHGGGANTTRDEERTALALHLSAAWLRQEENMFLSIPREVAATFPDRLQRLIGYELAAPYLGFVELDDPHKLLEEGESSMSGATNERLEAIAANIPRLRFGDLKST